MKFELTTTGFEYDEEDQKQLEKYGFKFSDSNPPKTKQYLNDIHQVFIEINSLKNLEDLSKEFGVELILDFHQMIIEIYDDYK